MADIETSTAREWIRIGRKLQELQLIADAYNNADISYSNIHDTAIKPLGIDKAQETKADPGGVDRSAICEAAQRRR